MSVVGMRRRCVAAITLIATGLGCGGSDGGTTPTTLTPTVSITLSAAALSIVQGAASTVIVTVTRGGGFTGDVTVSASGLPTGVTAGNVTIASGQTSGTLSINAASTAPAGTATLVLQATGSGVAASSATLTLTINAAQQAGSFTLSATPSPVSVAQGGSGDVTVTINRTNFTGAVNLSVAGAPTGVTTTLSSASVTGNTATITVAATAAAAAGNSTLTISGTGTGVTNQSTTVTLAITTQAPTGSFALSATPNTLSLAQGATGNVTVNIARTNFTGAVNLAVAGAPAGVTTALSASSVTGNTATLTFTAGAAAIVGSATITISGTGTGVSNQSTTVALTITAAQQPGTGNTTWKFCGTSGIPLWVAAQDGTGAWTRVTGTTDTYSFNITQARGGIAYVVPSGTGFDLEIFFGTSAELTTRGNELCNGALGAGKTVTAAITGTGATDLVQATLGPVAGAVSGGTATFSGVPNGTLDLVAGRATLTFTGTSVTPALQKIILRRDLNPAAGSALAPLDFGGAEGLTPVTRTMTINNLSGELAAVFGMYMTANNTLGLYAGDVNAAGSTRSWFGVPAASQRATDLHMLFVSAIPSLQNTLQTRNVFTVFKDAVDKTVTLGPALNAPTVTALTAAGYGRARAVITVQPEYNRHITFDIQQSGAAIRRTSIQQTGAYAAGSPLTIDVPDFSAVAGFDPNFGLKVGTQATVTVTATGWTGGGIVGPPLTEGATFSTGTRIVNVTP